MVGKIALHKLFEKAEFIPQAIISEPIEAVARRLNFDYEYGHDDFDEYEGIGLAIDDGLQFALLHYRGHEPGTVTVYLADKIRDVKLISAIIARIAHELEIDKASIQWQRRDNPEL